MSKVTHFKSEHEAFKDLEKKEHEELSYTLHIEDMTDVMRHITINPDDELDLANYYASIPGVEIDQDVTQFWQEQKSQLNGIKMDQERSEYLSAYHDLVSSREGLEDREHTARDFKRERADRIENLNSARQNLRSTQRQLNPFQTILFAIAGDSENYDKLKAAYKGIEKAEQQIKLLELEEKRAKETNDKLRAKKAFAGQRMLKVEEKIKEKMKQVKTVNDNSEDMAKKLEPQYEVIQHYRAIQSFKSELKRSGKEVAFYKLMDAKNPELSEDLKNMPDQMPPKTLKISLANPLTMEALAGLSQEKIAKIDGEISDLKGKLPEQDRQALESGTDLAVVKDNYLLVNGEKVTDVKGPEDTKRLMEAIKLNHMDKSELTPQEKLQMEYLQLKDKDFECTAKISEMVADLDVNNPEQVQQLQALQTLHKDLQERIQNTGLQQTLNTLDQLDQKMNEHKEAEQGQAFTRLPQVYKDLTLSEVIYDKTQSVSQKVFELFLKVEQEKVAHLEKERKKRALSQGKDPEKLQQSREQQKLEEEQQKAGEQPEQENQGPDQNQDQQDQDNNDRDNGRDDDDDDAR